MSTAADSSKSDYLPSANSIEAGIATTLALSAVRRYMYDMQGYSIWCAVGGFAAMEATTIGRALPNFLTRGVKSLLGFTPGEIAAAALGGLSLEVAVKGRVDLASLASYEGAETMIVGALSVLAAIYVAEKLAMLAGKIVGGKKQ